MTVHVTNIKTERVQKSNCTIERDKYIGCPCLLKELFENELNKTHCTNFRAFCYPKIHAQIYGER